MLDVKNVSAGYGGVEIIRDVSLSVAGGQIVSLLGANGAGKSTLLRVVSGLMRPNAGSVRFEGEDITGLRPDQVAARGLVQVPQGRHLFTRLPVQDNLLLGNTPRHARPHRQALLDKIFAMFPILAERKGQLAGTLSGGQQQMVAIGRALMGAPRLLVLDEPSIGLSPSVTLEVLGHIKALNEGGMTVLLVEQNVAQALSVSQHGYILENGAIALGGESQTLRHDPGVRMAYLGL
ncbi:ABC transporter ATP-binding protein [Ramlibacter sp. RBP-2]|uniref:ABC transporter ATP-binding protein n=1 Tax=Ramlibacter lithotrophicus TaxID=2606681 RepID=A0A7X6I8Z2_9BURK|nr:ABC transporter ATP-binding protein [Ramlibacter lithotrophicus]NKE68888.1 ABC transporter ATP-binding protein [Ramlibacter lithotrophicus]